MKQVLLINSKTRSPCRPTGLEYLAEGLVEAGYEVHLLDLTLEDRSERTVEEWLTNNHCDAVGISIFNTQWDKERDRVDFFLPEIRDMVSDIKRMTKAPIILGGYGFSMQPEDILEYVGGDFGVAGCGIPALPNLLERIKKNAVETGTVVREHYGKYLDIEFKRNIVNGNKYPENQFRVSPKDGCICNCFHCPFGRSKVELRLREPKMVIAEVRNLITQGAKKLAFLDCMINVPVGHAKSICKGLAELPIAWSANVYPVQKYLPLDLVDSMQQSGMFHAGIASRIIGSDRMLRVYGLEFDATDIEYTTKLFKERGITTSWFTGFGAPGECKQTIDETFALIDQAKPDQAGLITKARIYRHTELCSIAEKEGLVSPDDKLLEPVYYPFDDELRDYIWEEAGKRENCKAWY